MENIGIVLVSMIPAGVFIGAVAMMEVIFDFIYDHSQKFKEWADNYLYKE